MSLLDSFSNLFLPDADTSRARRLDVFGTESKAVVGTVIGVAAAAAIAAPVAIAAGGGVRATAAAAASRVAALPLTLKLGGAVVAPAVIGQITSSPKGVTRAAGGIANFEANVYKIGKDPTLENVKETFKENPIIATTVAGLGAAAVGTGVSGIVATALNTKAVKENTQSMIGGTPSSAASQLIPYTSQPDISESPASSVPLTPETQVMGKEVKSPGNSGIRRRSAPKKKETATNVRVNVLNQQTYIQERSR